MSVELIPYLEKQKEKRPKASQTATEAKKERGANVQNGAWRKNC